MATNPQRRGRRSRSRSPRSRSQSPEGGHRGRFASERATATAALSHGAEAAGSAPPAPEGRESNRFPHRRSPPRYGRRSPPRSSPHRRGGHYDDDRHGGGSRRGRTMTMEEILQLPTLVSSPRMLAEFLGESTQPSPELDRKFSEYQQEHRKRLAKPFFEQHKTERWFIEKYDPVHLEQRWTELVVEMQQTAQAVFSEFESGGFLCPLDVEEYKALQAASGASVPAVTQVPTQGALGASGPAGSGSEENADELAAAAEAGASATEPGSVLAPPPAPTASGEGGAADGAVPATNPAPSGSPSAATAGFSSAAASSAPTMQSKTTNSVFLKAIPPSVSKYSLRKLLASVPDAPLKCFRISDPARTNWHRLAWASYPTEQAATAVVAALNGTKIDDYEVSISLNMRGLEYERPRVTPAITSEAARQLVDLDQAKKLVIYLDKERFGADFSNPLIKADAELALQPASAATTVLRLDRFINYLRRVHFFVYYEGTQCEDADDVLNRFGVIHLRPKRSPDAVKERSVMSWVATLDSRVRVRLATPDSIHSMLSKSLFNKLLDGLLEKKSEEKYQCRLCSKLFMAPDYVRKHIHNKHPEKITELQATAVTDQFLLNYVKDPKKPTPAPPISALPSPGGMRGAGLLMTPQGLPTHTPFPIPYPLLPMPLPPGPGGFGGGHPGGRFGGMDNRGGGGRFERERDRDRERDRERDRGDRDGDRRGRPMRDRGPLGPLPNLPPPPGMREDPRAASVRSYVDLDAPPAGDDDLMAGIDFK